VLATSFSYPGHMRVGGQLSPSAIPSSHKEFAIDFSS